MVYIVTGIIGLIVLIGVLTFLYVRRNRWLDSSEAPQSNVVEFRQRSSLRNSKNEKNEFPTTNSPAFKQKCSFCKKEYKLTFYANADGTLFGVCKACKHKADRQDMLPL